MAIRGRPLDAVHRIARYCVTLAEIIQQGRECQEFPANTRGLQLARLQMLAPGNHVCARNGTQLRGRLQPCEE
jgi:hypothetical protein